MLTPEWKHRIENWQREIPNHLYRPLGTVALSGFVTKDQLAAEQWLHDHDGNAF